MRWNWIWSCPYDDEGWKVWMEDQIGKVALQALWEKKVQHCMRCELYKSRTNIVYGIGNTERPDLCFVGEGPGANEDLRGEPFVGRAGKLFDKILDALGYDRSDVYICNSVSCHPPENRDPLQPEIDACKPVWVGQVFAVRPTMVVALGKIAGNAILGTEGQSVAQMRKKIHTWNKLPLQVTYHPAAMLYDESYKQPAWEDLQIAVARVKRIRELAQDAGPLFGGTE